MKEEFDLQRDFEGQTAVVIGADGGIGAACVDMLRRRGADTIAIGRPRSSSLGGGGAGSTAEPLTADVRSASSLRHCFAELPARINGLHYLVYAVGTNGVLCAIEEMTEDEFDEVLSVNLRGAFLTVKFALPLLRRSKCGSIVIIGSIAGSHVHSFAGSTAYCASKSGLAAFAKAAALELAADGIRINLVSPGVVATGLSAKTQVRKRGSPGLGYSFRRDDVPLGGRLAEPEEVAAQVCHLLSEKSAYTTGSEIVIDGGLRLRV